MNLINSGSFDDIKNNPCMMLSGLGERSENLTGTETPLSLNTSDVEFAKVSGKTTFYSKRYQRYSRLFTFLITNQSHRWAPFEISASPIDAPTLLRALSDYDFPENPTSVTSNFWEFSGIVKNILAEPTDFVAQISGANHHEEIFSILDLAEHRKIATRLRYLHEITQDNDAEDPAMEFMSLRQLALFFVSDDVLLPDPEIGISPNGLLQVEWSSSKTSALMKFLSDGNIRFAGISTVGNKDKPQSIQGVGSKDLALQTILQFINQ